MPRILVIDDDRELTAMLVDYLAPEGFTVEVTHAGDTGLARLRLHEYDLVVLDVMLPGMNGLEVLRAVRAHSDCPVVMLTARGQELDRIRGLESGADDYIGKPFSARELLARLQAVLRRSGARRTPSDRLEVGDVVMDVAARVVRRDGVAVPLTGLEFDLLRELLRSAGEVVSRDALFARVLGRDYSVFDRAVDHHISSVRRKLGPLAGDVERIRAIRNTGYVYARTPAGSACSS